MRLAADSFLLDVNVLVALIEFSHQHHPSATKWFEEYGKDNWGTCAFTEAGFVRVMTNPKVGGRTVRACTEILALLHQQPGFRYWPVSARWHELIAPFEQRVVGHQQVTDAYLLGLAIQENGVLVTFDKGLRFLAGSQFARYLHFIE